jgi:catechol 2,3-dioxygenase-like lactoylglutathione lyase family enzyme
VYFDHLLHWVPDLDIVVRQYRDMGFPIRVGERHPTLGTRNAVWFAGPAYIELIAVEDEAAPWADWGLPRLAIEAALRAGGGALPFAVLVDDVAATLQALRARGFDAGDPVPGSIELPDGATATWTAGSLRNAPAWAPFFINYGGTAAEERRARFPVRTNQDAIYGGVEAVRNKRPGWAIDHLVLETPDPASATDWLADVLGLQGEIDRTGAGRVPLAGCPIVVAPGPADRITRVALTGSETPIGPVAGLRYVRAAPELSC